MLLSNQHSKRFDDPLGDEAEIASAEQEPRCERSAQGPACDNTSNYWPRSAWPPGHRIPYRTDVRVHSVAFESFDRSSARAIRFFERTQGFYAGVILDMTTRHKCVLGSVR